MNGYTDIPIWRDCTKSYPARPQIDPVTTPWTRDELDGKIDYYMDLIERAIKGAAK